MIAIWVEFVPNHFAEQQSLVAENNAHVMRQRDDGTVSQATQKSTGGNYTR